MIALLLALGATATETPTIEELLDATDDVARGEHSIAVLEMQVKTSRYERTMKMQAWSRGQETTLIKILEPAKDAGITTLKVDDNIWNYLPKVDRTMKVPAGMMSGAWMGSHFSNDDLVKESRLSEDFTYTMTATPDSDPDGNYVIELVPKPDAPVVWGKVITRVSADRLPVDIRYYDEGGDLARTMAFSDVTDLGGRSVPATMLLTPADKPEEFTRVTYVSLDFETDVPESMFSLKSLR